MAAAAGRSNGAWQGPWRLLRGLASIGSYGLGAFASQQASEAAKKLLRDGLAAQPAWLELLPDIEATGDVRVMQDAYGTRFAVIAGFCYPGGIDPSVSLFDIDACGTIRLAGAGVFDDVEQAAAAWREQADAGAEEVVRVPATAGSLACLVYGEHAEQILSGRSAARHEYETSPASNMNGTEILSLRRQLHKHRDPHNRPAIHAEPGPGCPGG